MVAHALWVGARHLAVVAAHLGRRSAARGAQVRCGRPCSGASGEGRLGGRRGAGGQAPRVLPWPRGVGSGCLVQGVGAGPSGRVRAQGSRSRRGWVSVATCRLTGRGPRRSLGRTRRRRGPQGGGTASRQVGFLNYRIKPQVNPKVRALVDQPVGLPQEWGPGPLRCPPPPPRGDLQKPPWWPGPPAAHLPPPSRGLPCPPAAPCHVPSLQCARVPHVLTEARAPMCPASPAPGPPGGGTCHACWAQGRSPVRPVSPGGRGSGSPCGRVQSPSHRAAAGGSTRPASGLLATVFRVRGCRTGGFYGRPLILDGEMFSERHGIVQTRYF